VPAQRTTWLPRFVERSSILAPLALRAETLLRSSEWPQRSVLQELLSARGVCNARGIPLRLVAADTNAHTSYEERVYNDGELQVRDRNWHDLFNVLAWATFPCAKAAINARHAAELLQQPQAVPVRGQHTRSRVRDALTLFDESGAVIASPDRDLIEELLAFEWKRLFWQHRTRVLQAMRFYVLGHAVFEKALDAYIGMTAHALVVKVDCDFMRLTLQAQIERIDAIVAERLVDPNEFGRPQTLMPLPLLGIPGWYAANTEESFYDLATYFRRARAARLS